MSGYAQHLREHLRLTLLKLLANDGGGYAANDSVLAGLVPDFGFRVGRDAVKTELAWLAEQGLVTTETVGDLTVATLTQRGLEAADGRAVVPGVQRPSPAG